MAPRALVHRVQWLRLLLVGLVLAPIAAAHAEGTSRPARTEVVVLPGPLVLAPLPEWLAPAPPGPPSLESRALQSLARLEGSSLRLGSVTLRARRAVQLGGRLVIGSDGPALGGWLRFELASRHLEVPLPLLQVLPQRYAGGLGVEVRATLFERRF